MLRDDPTALREVVDAHMIDVAVRDEFALASAKSAAQGAHFRLRYGGHSIALHLAKVVVAFPQWLSERVSPTRSGRQPVTFRMPHFVGAVALSFVIASAGTAWLTLRGAKGLGPVTWIGATNQKPASDVAASLARVAATRNYRWDGGLTVLGFGAEVAGGEIMQLEAGLAELSFPSRRESTLSPYKSKD